MSQTTRNNNANYVEKTGMSDFSLQTIANNNVVASDSVTGVALSGQRKKAGEVTLKWNSLTETNMSGYQIQRKLDNETDFSDRALSIRLRQVATAILNYPIKMLMPTLIPDYPTID